MPPSPSSRTQPSRWNACSDQRSRPLFADLHRQHGVDLILVGIGVQPDDQLAAAAGVTTDNGILVDARLRSDDPHVYAAGDVANHDHPVIGRIRVEHWDTAIHQGRHAARTMLGSDEPYIRQPYFFSDQYDLGMEYVGHVGPDGYDEVVIRGDIASRVITAFWIQHNHVVAGMHLNDWDSIDTIRTWVGQEATGSFRNARIALADIPD